MPATIIDLAQPLNDATISYPGDPVRFSCCNSLGEGFSLERGEGANLHKLTLGTHSGTHIDAPWHFIAEGAKVDELDLSSLVAPLTLLDLREIVEPRKKLEWSDLAPWHARIARAGERKAVLVLRTGWSVFFADLDRYRGQPFFSGDCAKRIAASGVRVIGVDTFSPDETPLPNGPDTPADAHLALLGAGIAIAENLRLEGLDDIWTPEDDDAGKWTISLLPLRLTGLDGSPIRAVAWRD